MLKLIATVALAATILVVLQGSGACFAAEVSPGSSTNIKAYQSPRASGEMDQGEAMKYCNESFTIKTDYLDDLNKTGSFRDETDTVPMCFLKCYLEKVGILSDEGDVNEERALQLWPDGNKDMIQDCLEEDVEKAGDICEKAYYMTRCVMTRALVDGRSKD